MKNEMNGSYCGTWAAVMLAAGLCCFAAKARAQASSVMPLHDCMVYAVSHSTEMRIQAADRSDAQWRRRQALVQAFTPVLSASTSAAHQFGRTLDPETNGYRNATSFHNGYSVSAGITLFDGFQAVNNVKMASVSVKTGASKEQMERDRICLATMEAYASAIYYAEMEKVVAEQVETARKARDRAVRQEELGLKGHAEVVQMESELAQKAYLLVSATNGKNQALLTLKDVMGWPVDEDLRLEADVDEPLCHGLDAGRLEGTAMSSLPPAQVASSDVKLATLDLKRARGAYAPSVGLQAGWSTTYYTYPGRADANPVSFGDQFRNNGGEYVQFQLSIPLFDQLRRRTTLQLKKNALVRAEAQYDQTMRDIGNEVRRAVSDRDGAQAAFHQADRFAAVQREAYRLSMRQFEEGLISAIAYQTASQTYLNAMAERMNALLQFRIKDAVVRFYNGEPYLNQ